MSPRRDGASRRMPAAALFDMDGLLIDTEPLWFAVESEILGEFGCSWDLRDHAQLVGSSLPSASVFLAARAGPPLTARRVADELLTRMGKALRNVPALQPGAAQLLAELDAAAVPKALVSSSFRVLVDAVLDALAPTSFDVVVAGDEVSSNKPHPEPYLRAADLLGADPRWCVAFEDSTNGADSATAAGCAVVAVPSMAPIPPAPRRLVVSSLHDVHLESLVTLLES